MLLLLNFHLVNDSANLKRRLVSLTTVTDFGSKILNSWKISYNDGKDGFLLQLKSDHKIAEYKVKQFR